MTTLEHVGFIGLGGMGRGLVKNLVAKGVAVTAYDLNPAAVAVAKSLGATAAKSVQEIRDNCRIIMICVNEAEDVEALMICGDGLLAAPRRGSSSWTTPPAVRKWSQSSTAWCARPAGATPRRR
jgi:3-hydroxyisobutyrate dehydrogenase-like beta-hydroxyacid dehydrogenase